MKFWQKVLCEGFATGSVASALSTATLVCFGKHGHGSAYGPTNAISHWLWGDGAFRKNRPSLRHTAVGYGIHHLSSVFWATLYSAVYGHRDEAKRPERAIVGGATVAAIACFVDYRLTPERLMPGFEHRLSRPELGGVYAAFGVGLALACIALGRSSRRRPLE